MTYIESPELPELPADAPYAFACILDGREKHARYDGEQALNSRCNCVSCCHARRMLVRSNGWHYPEKLRGMTPVPIIEERRTRWSPLVDSYSQADYDLIVRLDKEILTLAQEIVALPRWQWIRRSTLMAKFRGRQAELRVARMWADDKARDRLLIEAAKGAK